MANCWKKGRVWAIFRWVTGFVSIPVDYEHPSTPSKPSWANGGIPHFQASTYRSNKLGHKTSRREAIFFSFQVSLTRAGKTCLPVRLNAFLLINHTSHGLAKYGMIQGEQVWENTFLFPSDSSDIVLLCVIIYLNFTVDQMGWVLSIQSAMVSAWFFWLEDVSWHTASGRSPSFARS